MADYEDDAPGPDWDMDKRVDLPQVPISIGFGGGEVILVEGTVEEITDALTEARAIDRFIDLVALDGTHYKVNPRQVKVVQLGPAPAQAEREGTERADENLNWLLGETDAVVWAEEFIKLWGHRKDCIDEDLMLTWFACAMGAQKSEGARDPAPSPTPEESE